MKNSFNKIIVVCSTLLIVYATCMYLIDVVSRISARNQTPVVTTIPTDPIGAYNMGYYDVALKIFRPNAEKNDSTAQFYMGAMYFNGQGVPKDLVQAYMWVTLSKDTGNHLGVDGVKLVESQMSSSEIDTGKAMVEQWKTSHKSPIEKSKSTAHKVKVPTK